MSIWQRIEPYAFRLAQLALLGGVLWGGYLLARPYLGTLFGNPLHSSVVVFDVVKLANAQRKIASTFIKPIEGPTDAALTLSSVQKRTRDAIEKVAGRGTLVLVKQAVINNNLPDITDAVLRELGLPLDVPTQDAAAYVLDEAPTNLSLMPRPERKQIPQVREGKSGGLVP